MMGLDYSRFAGAGLFPVRWEAPQTYVCFFIKFVDGQHQTFWAYIDFSELIVPA